jgi:hypothetical protein
MLQFDVPRDALFFSVSSRGKGFRNVMTMSLSFRGGLHRPGFWNLIRTGPTEIRLPSTLTRFGPEVPAIYRPWLSAVAKRSFFFFWRHPAICLFSQLYISDSDYDYYLKSLLQYTPTNEVYNAYENCPLLAVW